MGLEKSHEEPRVKALESKVTVMPNARRYVTVAHAGIPIGLWDKRKEDDGEKPKTCVIFYFWTNAETEQDFKHKERRHGQTKYQLAEQELRDAGAESWKEEHWVPRKLPNISK
ncbi:uncharacterized protein N7498_006374 [Penicillium cinerascens]|uniref:Uncharacterized protein n=1 Tax=Penicillium cinerascens TaxID=70096 RepID=A0A9W9SXH6_9EURO|nr:uncharacterized protein N7498_006374 [Penicillium cinerascens]KAJ5201711.1 hypothetical protein N7498_006374 [Penicillium cinerascens]